MYQTKEDILESQAIQKQQDEQYEETLRADKAKVINLSCHQSKYTIVLISLIVYLTSGRRKETGRGMFNAWSPLLNVRVCPRVVVPK